MTHARPLFPQEQQGRGPEPAPARSTQGGCPRESAGHGACVLTSLRWGGARAPDSACPQPGALTPPLPLGAPRKTSPLSCPRGAPEEVLQSPTVAAGC